ncbi:hypothetical protein NC651_010650 [Populus alba x Populus x berolinensis]|nr:hypothetical protein NC651_010650 [Populus alba x Populus x berolinensis]
MENLIGNETTIQLLRHARPNSSEILVWQVRNLLLTGGLFCGPLLLTFSFLNTVAITYSATAALPFGTIVVIFLIWALVTTPLLVLGGIAGKNSKAEFQAPCRTTKYPREIPLLPWYRKTLPQMAMAGFLPFSAIYIELYYIFASVWGHRIYTIYSILFIVFIILLIVTAFITVALTYFQLAAEDHEWWWRSLSKLLEYPSLSSVVDQLACSFMAIACITTLQDQICLASCKPHFSLATWPAFVMVSSSCLEALVSVLPCSLSAIFTTQSSASRKSHMVFLVFSNLLSCRIMLQEKQLLAGKMSSGIAGAFIPLLRRDDRTSNGGLLQHSGPGEDDVGSLSISIVLKSSSSHSLKSIHLYNSLSLYLSISLCSVYELQRAKMEMKLVPCLVVSILILCNVTRVRSDASNNRYKVGDDVPLYVNKVGPFHNPSETYRYFDLPFCSSGPTKDKKEALGELLNGDRLVTAPYKLDFLNDKDSEIACKKRLTKEQVAQFREAVSKDYYFQMYYDDLPVWGFIGKVEKEGKNDPSEYKYYLFKHLHFTIFYNKDRVIEIAALSDQKNVVELTENKEVNVEFMYSVKWKETEIPYEKRMEKYSQSSSLPHHLEIHWFSIINSCVTVLLLTGFLATILMRVLKNDFVKYAHDEESAEDQEETGWKYIHGDVFRYPKYKSVLAAAVGSGTQLFTLTTFIFLLALVGVFYPYNRGALFTALVVIYALTAGIAGYTAASFFCQLEGTNWVSDHEFLSHCLLHTSLSLLGMPLKLVITVSQGIQIQIQ